MTGSIELLLQEGIRARREHRPMDARRVYTEAIQLCRPAGARAQLVRALKGLGQIERDLRDTDAALALYEEATAICRTLDDPLLLANTVRHIGDLLSQSHQYDTALPCFLEALAIYREHPEIDSLDLANAIRGLALLKSRIGGSGEIEQSELLAESKQLWADAGMLYAQLDIFEGVAECQRQVAQLSGAKP